MHRSRTALVVAHPDDEALWLSSAVASADRIAFCFGALFDRPRKSQARRQAVAALARTGIVDLAIPESGVGFSPDRAALEPAPTGVAIEDAGTRERYESNYARLTGALRTALAGFEDVYTHNPWGEYGHPEHIQVHRAVAAVQGELGFTIWFSNYVGAVSWPLARRLGGEVRWAQRRIVQPDLATARALMRIYRRHGAWTWSQAHRWPARETMYAQPAGGSSASRHPLAGEWLLDVGRLRWWSPTWRLARRRLPPLGLGPGRDGDVHAPPGSG